MKAISQAALRRSFIALMLAILTNSFGAFAQETIFTGLKSTILRANTHFKNKEYKNALDLYLMADKSIPSANTKLQIARTYYYLNDLKQSASWFKNYLRYENTLSEADILKYAEALCGIHNYQEGIKWYTAYLDVAPDDELIMKKIWRLKTIRYLYEDSTYYVIRPLAINTTAAELCPTIVGNELVFMSNRKITGFTDRSDATNNMPFFRLFKSDLSDTLNSNNSRPFKSRLLCPELKSRFHEGPASFFDNGLKMIYSATSVSKEKTEGQTVLKLYFAEKVNKHWVARDPFPYNSDTHSMMHPSITEDGKLLFFVSDMKGGFGKKDLYKSEYKNGQWSKPVNLGDQINTKENEEFPYIHGGTILYFSSDGHPGFGGIDLFKTAVTEGAVGEIQNLGYPLNNNSDDFGITLNADGTHGFFSSNRSHGGLDDDIFEVELNLQTYPLVLTGLLRYKTNDAKDSSNLKILSGASLFVIDNVKQAVVSTTTSDKNGEFSIVIPYFSQYRIRVVEDDGSETIVSLDISKQRKSENSHEIVIVKDVFKNPLDKN